MKRTTSIIDADVILNRAKPVTRQEAIEVQTSVENLNQLLHA
jgi:hypothetical protein